MIKESIKNIVNKTAFLCCFVGLSNYVFASDEISPKDTAKQKEKGFTYNFGGKAQLRADTYKDLFSNNGEQETDYYLRKAELSLEGQFVPSLRYELKIKADYEGDVSARDAYIAYDLPHKSELVVGRFDPDFGLELTGSSSWTTANERSAIWDLVKNAGDGSDGHGIGLRTAHKHYFMSLGSFDFSNSQVVSARAVYMPINNRKQVLHLGYSVRNERYDMADTGVIRTDLGMWGVHVNDNGNSIRLARDSRAFGFDEDLAQVIEVAYAYGPFSLQAEYLDKHSTAARNAVDRDAKGNYIQVAYTLTGESRNYNTKNATFGKIKSKRDFGAWEIFYRHDKVETQGEIGMLSGRRTAGEANSRIAGVNWYACDYLKVSLNHIVGEAPLIPNDHGDEQGEAYSLQVQLKF